MKNSGAIDKTIALLVVVTFLVSNLYIPGDLFAQTAPREAIPPINVRNVELDSNLTGIQEIFTSEATPKTAILIQDAHGILDAQKNIRSIIQELQGRYGFELVALEGGKNERADHTFFRTFPNKEASEKVVSAYLKRAELSGGEAAAILNPKEGIFWGLEDSDLYFRNRNSFLKGLELKTSNLHTLNLLDRKLSKVIDSIYPADLRTLHLREQEYLKERISLLEFLDILETYLKKDASISLSADYPNLDLLLKSKGEDYSKLTKEEAKKREIELTSKIEGKKLFHEIKRLTQTLKDHLIQKANSDIQTDLAALDSLYQRMEILKSLSSLEITKEDYKSYLAHPKDYDFLNFVEFLDKYKDSINLTLDLKPALAFYEDALKRDDALFQNLLAAMDKEKKDRAIIVAGGFHTEGIRERLEKNGISYLILSPRITNIPEENPYYRVMQGQASWKKTSSSKISQILETMGLAGKAEDFLGAYTKGGLSEVVNEAKAQSGKPKEQIEKTVKAWEAAIITATKSKDPLADPSGLLNLVKEFTREAVRQGVGASEILQNIQTGLKFIVEPTVKAEAERFVSALAVLAREGKLNEENLDAAFKLTSYTHLDGAQIAALISQDIAKKPAEVPVGEVVPAKAGEKQSVLLGQVKPTPEAVTAFVQAFEKTAGQSLGVGDFFDEAAIDKTLITGEGTISQTEKFIVYGNKTYIVWFKGPQKGKINRILENPTPEQLKKSATADEILNFIDGKLEEMNDREKQPFSDPMLLELLLYIQRTYDGGPGQIGMKESRFYDPSINELALAFQSKGVKNWLIVRATQKGFKNIKIWESLITPTETEAFTRYFYGIDAKNLAQNEYFDAGDPVVLIHGTYDNILTDVLNEQALVSNDARDKEITKKTGEGYGSGSYTPGDVSFWYYPNGRASITGGHGSRRGLESPMAFGIAQSKAKSLEEIEELVDVGGEKMAVKKVRNGTMNEERVVRWRVPLADVTHIFVPYFAVEETRNLLALHGFGNIKVMPLGFKYNQPVVPAERPLVASPASGQSLGSREVIARTIKPAFSQSFGRDPLPEEIEKVLEIAKRPGMTVPNAAQELIDKIKTERKTAPIKVAFNGTLKREPTPEEIDKVLKMAKRPGETVTSAAQALANEIAKPVISKEARILKSLEGNFRARFDRPMPSSIVEEYQKGNIKDIPQFVDSLLKPGKHTFWCVRGPEGNTIVQTRIKLSENGKYIFEFVSKSNQWIQELGYSDESWLKGERPYYFFDLLSAQKAYPGFPVRQKATETTAQSLGAALNEKLPADEARMVAARVLEKIEARNREIIASFKKYTLIEQDGSRVPINIRGDMPKNVFHATSSALVHDMIFKSEGRITPQVSKNLNAPREKLIFFSSNEANLKEGYGEEKVKQFGGRPVLLVFDFNKLVEEGITIEPGNRGRIGSEDFRQWGGYDAYDRPIPLYFLTDESKRAVVAALAQDKKDKSEQLSSGEIKTISDYLRLSEGEVKNIASGVPAPVIAQSLGVEAAADEIIEAYQTGGLTELAKRRPELNLNASELEAELSKLASQVTKNKINELEVDLYSDDGSAMIVYSTSEPGLGGVVIKVPLYPKNAQETERIQQNYELAKQRLGGLFPATVITKVFLKTPEYPQGRAYPFIVVQTKIEKLLGDALQEAGEGTREYQAILDQLTQLWEGTMKRGLADSDLQNVEMNYGITPDGKVILMDADKMTQKVSELPMSTPPGDIRSPLDRAIADTLNFGKFFLLSEEGAKNNFKDAMRVPDLFEDEVRIVQKQYLIAQLASGKSLGVGLEETAVLEREQRTMSPEDAKLFLRGARVLKKAEPIAPRMPRAPPVAREISSVNPSTVPLEIGKPYDPAAMLGEVSLANLIRTDRVLKTYEIRRVLGEGAQGIVLLASKGGRNYAIKIYNERNFRKLPGRLSESQALNRLKGNEGVPGLYLAGAHGGYHDYSYAVTDFIPGDSLDRYEKIGFGALTFEQRIDLILNVLGGVAEVLKEAHRQGILHCDIKTGNILYKPREGKRAPTTTLIDWGLAVPLADKDALKSGAVTGSQGYMPPELLKNDIDNYDGRADLYALGVVALRLLEPGGSDWAQRKFTERGFKLPQYTYHPSAEQIEKRNGFRLRNEDYQSKLAGLALIIESLTQWDPNDRLQSAKDLLMIVESVKKESAQSQETRFASPNRFAISPEQYSSMARSLGAENVPEKMVGAPESIRGPPRSFDIGLGIEQFAKSDQLMSRIERADPKETPALLEELNGALASEIDEILPAIRTRSTHGSLHAALEKLKDILVKNREGMAMMVTVPLADITNKIKSLKMFPAGEGEGASAVVDFFKDHLNSNLEEEYMRATGTPFEELDRNAYEGTRIVLLSVTKDKAEEILANAVKRTITDMRTKYGGMPGAESLLNYLTREIVYHTSHNRVYLSKERGYEALLPKAREFFPQNLDQNFPEGAMDPRRVKPEKLFDHYGKLSAWIRQAEVVFADWKVKEQRKIEILADQAPDSYEYYEKRDSFMKKKREYSAVLAAVAKNLMEDLERHALTDEWNISVLVRNPSSTFNVMVDYLLTDAYKKLYERAEFAEAVVNEYAKKIQELEDSGRSRSEAEALLRNDKTGLVYKEILKTDGPIKIAFVDDGGISAVLESLWGQTEALEVREANIKEIYREFDRGRRKAIPLFIAGDKGLHTLARPDKRIRNIYNPKEETKTYWAQMMSAMEALRSQPVSREALQNFKKAYYEYRITMFDALLFAYRDNRFSAVYKASWMNEIFEADQKGALDKWYSALLKLNSTAPAIVNPRLTKMLAENIQLLKPGVMVFKRPVGDEVGIVIRLSDGKDLVIFGEGNGVNAFFKEYPPQEWDPEMYRIFAEIVSLAGQEGMAPEQLAEGANKKILEITRGLDGKPKTFHVTMKVRPPAGPGKPEGEFERMPVYFAPGTLAAKHEMTLYARNSKGEWYLLSPDPAKPFDRKVTRVPDDQLPKNLQAYRQPLTMGFVYDYLKPEETPLDAFYRLDPLNALQKNTPDAARAVSVAVLSELFAGKSLGVQEKIAGRSLGEAVPVLGKMEEQYWAGILRAIQTRAVAIEKLELILPSGPIAGKIKPSGTLVRLQALALKTALLMTLFGFSGGGLSAAEGMPEIVRPPPAVTAPEQQPAQAFNGQKFAEKVLTLKIDKKQYQETVDAFPHIAQSFKGLSFADAQAANLAKEKIAFINAIVTKWQKIDPDGFSKLSKSLNGILIRDNNSKNQLGDSGYGIPATGIVAFSFEKEIPAITDQNIDGFIVFLAHELAHLTAPSGIQSEIDARGVGLEYMKRLQFPQFLIDQEQFMVDLIGQEIKQGATAETSAVWKWYWAMDGSSEAEALKPLTAAQMFLVSVNQTDFAYEKLERNKAGDIQITFDQKGKKIEAAVTPKGSGKFQISSDLGKAEMEIRLGDQNTPPQIFKDGQEMKIMMVSEGRSLGRERAIKFLAIGMTRSLTSKDGDFRYPMLEDYPTPDIVPMAKYLAKLLNKKVKPEALATDQLEELHRSMQSDGLNGALGVRLRDLIRDYLTASPKPKDLSEALKNEAVLTVVQNQTMSQVLGWLDNQYFLTALTKTKTVSEAALNQLAGVLGRLNDQYSLTALTRTKTVSEEVPEQLAGVLGSSEFVAINEQDIWTLGLLFSSPKPLKQKIEILKEAAEVKVESKEGTQVLSPEESKQIRGSMDEVSGQSLGAQELNDVFNQGVASITVTTNRVSKNVYKADFKAVSSVSDKTKQRTVTFQLIDEEGEKILSVSGERILRSRDRLQMVSALIGHLKNLWRNGQIKVSSEDDKKRLSIILGTLSDEEKEGIDLFAKELTDQLKEMGGVTVQDIKQAVNLLNNESVSATGIFEGGTNPFKIYDVIRGATAKKSDKEPNFKREEVKRELFRRIGEEFTARSLGAEVDNAKELVDWFLAAGWNGEQLLSELERIRLPKDKATPFAGTPVTDAIDQFLKAKGTELFSDLEFARTLIQEMKINLAKRSGNPKILFRILFSSPQMIEIEPGVQVNSLEALQDLQKGALAFDAEGRLKFTGRRSGEYQLGNEMRRKQMGELFQKNYGVHGMISVSNSKINHEEAIRDMNLGLLNFDESSKVVLMGMGPAKYEAYVTQKRKEMANEFVKYYSAQGFYGFISLKDGVGGLPNPNYEEATYAIQRGLIAMSADKSLHASAFPGEEYQNLLISERENAANRFASNQTSGFFDLENGDPSLNRPNYWEIIRDVREGMLMVEPSGKVRVMGINPEDYQKALSEDREFKAARFKKLYTDYGLVSIENGAENLPIPTVKEAERGIRSGALDMDLGNKVVAVGMQPKEFQEYVAKIRAQKIEKFFESYLASGYRKEDLPSLAVPLAGGNPSLAIPTLNEIRRDVARGLLDIVLDTKPTGEKSLVVIPVASDAEEYQSWLGDMRTASLIKSQMDRIEGFKAKSLGAGDETLVAQAAFFRNNHYDVGLIELANGDPNLAQPNLEDGVRGIENGRLEFRDGKLYVTGDAKTYQLSLGDIRRMKADFFKNDHQFISGPFPARFVKGKGSIIGGLAIPTYEEVAAHIQMGWLAYSPTEFKVKYPNEFPGAYQSMVEVIGMQIRTYQEKVQEERRRLEEVKRQAEEAKRRLEEENAAKVRDEKAKEFERRWRGLEIDEKNLITPANAIEFMDQPTYKEATEHIRQGRLDIVFEEDDFGIGIPPVTIVDQNPANYHTWLLETRGKSLGAELTNDEMRYLAVRLLGVEAVQAPLIDTKALLGKLGKPAVQQQLAESLKQAMLAELAARLSADEDALKLLIQTQNLMNERLLDERINSILANVLGTSLAQDKVLETSLNQMFKDVLKGKTLDDIEQAFLSEAVRQNQLKKFADTLDLPMAVEDIGKLTAEHAKVVGEISPKQEPVVIAMFWPALPGDPIQRQAVLEAFRTGGADSVEVILRTKEEMKQFNQFVSANNQWIGFLNSTRAFSPKEQRTRLEALQKKVVGRGDGFMFVSPEAFETRVDTAVYSERDVPKGLRESVNQLMAQVALEAARLFHPSAKEAERTKYFDYLKDSFGIQISKDAVSGRLVINFSVEALLQKLLTLQQAEERIKVAA